MLHRNGCFVFPGKILLCRQTDLIDSWAFHGCMCCVGNTYIHTDDFGDLLTE